eukprot:5422676-Prymnesium_polylepis.1
MPAVNMVALPSGASGASMATRVCPPSARENARRVGRRMAEHPLPMALLVTERRRSDAVKHVPA